MSHVCRIAALLTLFVGISSVHSKGSAKPTYEIFDLGTLGGSWSLAEDINDSGEVVGWSQLADGDTRGFRYSEGQLQAIELPPTGWSSDARKINARGWVVGGYGTRGIRGQRPYLDRNGRFVDLGFDRAEALAVNNRGQVVINANNHVYLYRKGKVADLGTMGGERAIGVDINSSGDIVGYNYLNGINRGFVYSDGAFLDIGTLGGLETIPQRINSSGEIAGYSQTEDGSNQPFLFRNGTMFSLGFEGTARGLNDRGDIVGDIAVPNAAPQAFLYTKRRLINLNSLVTGWDNLETALAVNNAGEIVGYGRINGEQHAFLLTKDR